jgi:hypothetical protein
MVALLFYCGSGPLAEPLPSGERGGSKVKKTSEQDRLPFCVYQQKATICALLFT